MTVQELIDKTGYHVVSAGDSKTREITKPFCCDLLSIAMGKTPEGAAWVTVMGNINTLAVATLTDAACVILAEGTQLDMPAQEKAEAENVIVLQSEEPIFETALQVYQLLNGSN